MGGKRWGQLACLLAAAGIMLTAALFLYAQNIRKVGRDQTCKVFEDAHYEEVRDLREAYDYFKNPPKDFIDYFKNDPRALMQLRRLEREAANDEDSYGAQVPPICDEPGYGRPEPDPELPPKPKGLP